MADGDVICGDLLVRESPCVRRDCAGVPEALRDAGATRAPL